MLVLAILSIGLSAVQLAHAPGEVYSLALSSTRVQEYNTPGITISLNVTSASIGTNYQFTFTVSDPTGAITAAVTSTTPSNPSFLTSVVYPKDFGPNTAVKYVGNYTVNVDQNKPSTKLSVQTGRFLVGLTDNLSYGRTYQVSMKAAGYGTSESITIRLSQGGVSVPGFPLSRPADVNGSFSFPWQIPPNATIGTYTLTLTGSTTPKTPTDTQTFAVNQANVIIPGLTVNSPTISRTLTQQFLFAPQYPSGQRIQTGQATIRIAEPDGVTHVSANGTYDGLTGTFRATYRLPTNAITGIWVATIDTNVFDDGYGNKGPGLTIATGFYVQSASLDVAITETLITGKTFNAGDVIPIYASIKYPDGTLFDSGLVVAKLLNNGLVVGTPITLSYIPGQQEWAGSYQVRSSDPAGIWVVTLDASDQPGNTGQEILSVIVSIPPITPPPSQASGMSTSFFLLIAAIVAAAALAGLLGALLLHRKKVTRSEVKLDLSVVDKEVGRIQESAFFQRVKRQVEDKKSPESNGEPPKDTKEQ